MDTRHLVDPELVPLLEFFPSLTFPDDLAGFRRGIADLAPADSLDGATTTVRTVGEPAVSVEVTRPTAAAGALPAVLWIHGGGYVIGGAAQNRGSCEKLALDLGCVVVSVDYSLAPEAPFPVPAEECYAALRWLHDQADELGVDPARIAVAGESAGAGLAAAVALLARDRGHVPLRFQALVYPMLDDRTVVSTERNPTTGEFVWRPEHNAFGWASYLGRDPGGPGVSPYAAPGRCTDLSGLAPAFVGVGALDLFLDENLSYADRLLRAGVGTELHVYPGAYHGFLNLRGTRLGDRLDADLATSLRTALT